MRSVIDKELLTLISNPKQSATNVEDINETFLKEHTSSYECCVEAAKLIYDLNPTANQKRALDLLTDLSNKQNSINIKVKSSELNLKDSPCLYYLIWTFYTPNIWIDRISSVQSAQGPRVLWRQCGRTPNHRV